jgi:hypothetical protein
MIKIKKTLAELDDLAQKHYLTLTSTPFFVDQLISDKLGTRIPDVELRFYRALSNSLRQIVIGRPNELEILRQAIEPLYLDVQASRVGTTIKRAKTKLIKDLKEEVLSIFNYSMFSSKRLPFAYELAQNLGANVCLYCNRQYTFTLKGNEKSTRPQFDHFYDKAKHPYFAVSFYNLVPSCSICNSSLKGTDEFNATNNLHPFIDDANNVMSFRIDVSAIDFVDGKKSTFNISLKPEDSSVNPDLYKRAERNAKAFRIEDLMNMHKDYVVELIKKAYYYDEEKISQLSKFKTDDQNFLFANRAEVMEFVLGNYIIQEKFGDRVLSKLTKDIAKQLGLLDHL